MIIQNMFEKDINRPINGVIKVDQDAQDVVRQEVEEYIITKELKRHFINFFNYYSDAFQSPTSDTGVWISGFFGSGKSHFLKMLSYLLENREIDGTPVVEFFRKKFEGDQGTFMMIDEATQHETETILFNIDVEGPMNKDKTAVLRVFAKMFYNHLGFFGENLKVTMMEKYIDEQGKTEEFRRVFEEKNGKPWVDQRKAFAFNGKYIIPTLEEVLGMSEEDAQNWFNDKSSVDFSIATLVEDIKAYVNKKPDDFRLIFLADEVGQYVGTDTDMLLNLQSMIEEIGSECGGKVWIMCTGQEAIDEIIRVRSDEFSRIQARFKTRLSLSSSSVDEVIQKRILKKTPEAKNRLEEEYNTNDAALRNLFTFKDSVLDIKGYSGPVDFSTNYPFVPYQFIIMQKVFTEIRKHGNSGKHLSGGERSMLSGFQEAAQKIEDRDEHALVPFYRFYDTVHTFLDSSIRRVVERCEKAAENREGVEPQDVDTLKLLYLIRYIDDIPANLDDIVILMADDIRMDKISMREKVRGSLDRLLDQNYIGRTGEVYNFLTDEEQDVAREIKNTQADTSTIVNQLGNMIFGDIYTSKKYRYDIYDFSFDEMVDGMTFGAVTGGMRLRILTVATDATEKNELQLMTESKGQAIVVLPDSSYYDKLESAMKIRKYVKQLNVPQLPKSRQDIIHDQQDEAAAYEAASLEALKEAIVNATFYVDGERLEIKSGDAKSKIDQALEYLVSHVYGRLNLITKNAQSDADIIAILNCDETYLPGTEPNRDAAADMEEYLEMQHMKNLPTSMADVQSRYQAIPFGWREIDIAAVVAQLIVDQKVTVKYGGMTIRSSDPKLPDMLRKKSEIGKTGISIREVISTTKIRAARDFLREYFDIMDVPGDEDGLIAFIIEKFTEQYDYYTSLNNRYDGHKYPDRTIVQRGISLIEDVLSQQKDNFALIDRLLKREDELDENKEQMQRVEGFFNNQVQVFDAAVKLEADLRNDLDYLSREPEANEALNQIRLICNIGTESKFDYKRIPELNGLMDSVHAGHDRLLASKRDELLENVRQCMEAIHTAANGDSRAKNIIQVADNYYTQKKQQTADYTSLALLDGLLPPMLTYMDTTVKKIEDVVKPVDPNPKPSPIEPETQVKKVYKSLNRSIVFPAKRLESKEDIDAYLEKMRTQLEQLLQNCDGIDLK